VTGLVVTDRLLRLARTAALRTFRTPRDTTSIVVSGADYGLTGFGYQSRKAAVPRTPHFGHCAVFGQMPKAAGICFTEAVQNGVRYVNRGIAFGASLQSTPALSALIHPSNFVL